MESPTPLIYLHNTLTGKKEPFTPITAGEVSMYHCGPTVYDYLHIGNLRAYVFADTLRRMFEANGYRIHQVINITDVGHLTANNDEGLGDDGEDKVEKMARSSGKTAGEISDYYTKVFFDDIHTLGIQTEGTTFPKASEHIVEQIEMIKVLEEKGFTYKTTDGIYFDTSKYSEYGKLGNINLKGLVEGARIGINDEKKNITDFALWKFSHIVSPTGVSADGKSAEKRFQEWESPWGIGFPGWHIECSAMSAKYLGNTFDIHTGGIDHIPVHHNNEIAQSECAHNGSPLAHYWLHNAFVNSDGKMSKSKGEFTRLVTLVEKGIRPVEYRYWLLQAQYSSQLQYTEEAVHAAAAGYKNLVAHVAKILVSASGQNTQNVQNAQNQSVQIAEAIWNEILALINDDLNTPLCISKLWDVLKDDSIEDQVKIEIVKRVDQLLGLDLIKNAEIYTDSQKASLVSPEEIPSSVKELLEKRKNARIEKDWKLSDSLRDEVRDLGFEILDSESGQTLKRI